MKFFSQISSIRQVPKRVCISESLEGSFKNFRAQAISQMIYITDLGGAQTSVFTDVPWVCRCVDCVDTFGNHELAAQYDSIEGATGSELGHLGLHSWLWAGPCLTAYMSSSL